VRVPGAPVQSGWRALDQRRIEIVDSKQARGSSNSKRYHNDTGRREVLGMAAGSSEAEPFWLDFLERIPWRFSGIG
jgi:hypothetical protein